MWTNTATNCTGHDDQGIAVLGSSKLEGGISALAMDRDVFQNTTTESYDARPATLSLVADSMKNLLLVIRSEGVDQESDGKFFVICIVSHWLISAGVFVLVVSALAGLGRRKSYTDSSRVWRGRLWK